VSIKLSLISPATIGESIPHPVSSNQLDTATLPAQPLSKTGDIGTLMTEPTQKTAAPQQIPEELALEVRRLAHDLSNALEIIVQTSYLLNLAELKEPASEWLRMLDSGVNRALEINLQLRDYIKTHTPR